MNKRTEVALFALLMLVVVPLEVLCALLAYETLGEIMRAIYLFLVVLNLPIVFLALRSRLAAGFCAVALAAVIIPYQVMLCDRLIRVQAEAGRIVTWAYESRIASGQFPADLSMYRFRDGDMKPFVQQYQRSAESGGFALFYRVGTESTSHSYSPVNGWGYYPD